MAQRHLIYVHGICRHEAGFSDPWFSAMKPYVPSLGAGGLGINRHEVLWSDVVNSTDPVSLIPRSAAAITAVGSFEKQSLLKRRLVQALENRVGGEVLRTMRTSASAGDTVSAMEAGAGLPSIPGGNCLDDFVKYLGDSQVRSQVLSRFNRVVGPLLETGGIIDVIAHSWGTVVAYEGLRSFDGIAMAGSVKNFFTTGSALSIGLIRGELLPVAADGKRPQIVDRWVNIDARGDIVGGSLIDEGYELQSQHEFLDLQPTGCPTFGGFVNPSCAHGSYFRSANIDVNHGIFGGFIEAP